MSSPVTALTLEFFFPFLKTTDLSIFQKKSLWFKVKKGRSVFISGDNPKAIYGVVKGCLKVVRENEHGDSFVTRLVVPGQLVGMREIIKNTIYDRSAVALNDSEVICIDREIFLDSIEKNHRISVQFMYFFCNELTKLESRIEAKSWRSAKSRVAEIILELYALFAKPGSFLFDIPLNRKDIGELADITQETVTRSIRELVRSRCLKASGRSFFIVDLEALRYEASLTYGN